MATQFQDTKGNAFILPELIGGEERHSTIAENLVLHANTEYFMEYIKDNGKQIKYEPNFSSDEDYSLYDVVISKQKYGGHEIYVKDSPENKDLIEMIDSTYYYPLLNDEKYSILMQEEYERFFQNGTAQQLFYDEMSEWEKDALTDMSNYTFSTIKNDSTSTLFPDEYKMSENDILEYVIRESECSQEEILSENISKESLKIFHDNFETLVEDFEKNMKPKKTQDKNTAPKM